MSMGQYCGKIGKKSEARKRPSPTSSSSYSASSSSTDTSPLLLKVGILLGCCNLPSEVARDTALAESVFVTLDLCESGWKLVLPPPKVVTKAQICTKIHANLARVTGKTNGHKIIAT